jgi:hypothetical protein
MADEIREVLTQHDRTRRSTDIPLFYGRKEKDTISPQQLLDRLDRAMGIAAWNEERVCDEFYMCLREKAISWYHTLDNIVGFNKANWADLKTEFLNAYAPRFTARTLCTSFQDLRQRAEENVQDFYNRVSDVFRDAYQVKPAHVTTDVGERHALTQAQANTVRNRGIMAMQLLVMNTVFLGGLKEEIRTKVLEHGPTEIRESVKYARELEVIVHDRKTKGSHISSIQDQDEDTEQSQYDQDEEEEILNFINNIRARRGKRPFQRNGRGRGGQRGGRNGPGNQYNGAIVVKCRYCQITGHFQKECRKRIAANAPLVDVHGKPIKINSVLRDGNDEGLDAADTWDSLN